MSGARLERFERLRAEAGGWRTFSWSASWYLGSRQVVSNEHAPQLLIFHSPAQQLGSDINGFHLSDEELSGATPPKARHTSLSLPSSPEPLDSAGSATPKADHTPLPHPSTLPRVNCLPYPPHTNPRCLWVYGHLIADNVRKRLVAEMPTLGRISLDNFFEVYPVIARKLLGVNEKTANEVRLVACQVHVSATRKIPELYRMDLTNHMPRLVLSLFTFTKRAFRTLPSQAAVDEVTDMMGSPPVWWPLSNDDSDGSTAPKANQTPLPSEPSPEPPAPVDCTPYPPYTKPRRAWVYGYVISTAVRNRLIVEFPALEPIPPEYFAKALPYVACQVLKMVQEAVEKIPEFHKLPSQEAVEEMTDIMGSPPLRP
ncbi:uncharacterized protein BXZ73DRAFT_79862 [Epithele typhae]|uniref:uncharacterized protein n=1 Tax=Epithele typhae TaxID=378194 RepID=UPI00200735CD|nr:uncharacterized protein BXZ73DRAFT_79862 [Epithele typhae]KAH9921722.1 hypothetical protein BXZ73DRAFT_79862 [Epithele typhae]